MAWKYREIEIEDGDVLDPQDWNQNIGAYTEEINGFIDRDNLRENQINVFTEVEVRRALFDVEAAVSVTVQTLNLRHQGWQQVENLALSIVAESDELFIAECGLQLQHDVYHGPVSEIAPDDPVSGYFIDNLFIEAMMTIDGFEVAYGGPLTAYYTHLNFALMGALPVTAGAHEVRVYVRLGREEYLSETWKDEATFCYLQARNLHVLRRKR
jgi:hypothetical protein